MTTLKERYLSYFARVRTAGAHILNYTCPCCQASIDTVAPTDVDECWDTATLCPFCEHMHFKIVRHASVEAVVLESEQ